MKLRVILLACLGAFIVLSMGSNSSGPSGGAGDRTGAPGSNGTCSGCHGGGNFGTTFGVVAKDAQNQTVTSYVPGETYTLEFTVGSTSGSPQYGMQATVLDANNASVGSLANASSNAKVSSVGNRAVFEQNSPSSTGTFTVEWTAPNAGTGDVSIYGTGMAVNGVGTGGDDPETLSSPVVLTEATSTSVHEVRNELADFNIFPLPANNTLNIISDKQVGDANVQLYSLTGQVVLQKQVYLGTNEQLSLDVSELAAGTYSLAIQKEGKVQSRLVQIRR